MMKHGDFYEFGFNTTKQVIMAEAVYTDEMPTYGKETWIDLLLKGKYQGFEFPVIFKQNEGFRRYDILPTYTSSLYLISDKLKELFESENFTGWQVFPIKLLDKKGGIISGYNGFSVLGKCGPVDYFKGQLIERPHHYFTGKTERKYKGLYVGLDRWDGSDFFLPDGDSGTIVTKRVAEIIRINNLTNVELTNLLDWEIDGISMDILRRR